MPIFMTTCKPLLRHCSARAALHQYQQLQVFAETVERMCTSVTNAGRNVTGIFKLNSHEVFLKLSTLFVGAVNLTVEQLHADFKSDIYIVFSLFLLFLQNTKSSNAVE